jgi:hypothetical protein
MQRHRRSIHRAGSCVGLPIACDVEYAASGSRRSRLSARSVDGKCVRDVLGVFFLRLRLILFLLLAMPLVEAQSESALRSYFEGKLVRVKIDMPATHDGVDCHVGKALVRVNHRPAEARMKIAATRVPILRARYVDLSGDLDPAVSPQRAAPVRIEPAHAAPIPPQP